MITSQHVNRKLSVGNEYGGNKVEKSEFLIVPMDQQGPHSVALLFKDENFAKIDKERCKNKIYCGVPPVVPFVLRHR